LPIPDQTEYFVDAATDTEDQKGGLGAILCQTDEKGNPRVIYYTSRALSINEKNYTPFLLETQAACWVKDNFSTFLKRSKINSLHKP
jgi:hypothetical protein